MQVAESPREDTAKQGRKLQKQTQMHFAPL